MVRVRVRTPSPHCALQADHCDQSDTVHAVGQASVLQGSVSVSAGHAAPPLAGAVVTLRVRCEVPPPQLQAQTWVREREHGA